MAERRRNRLDYLENLEDQHSKRRPDIRGFAIEDKSGTRIGSVQHVLADTETHQPRYLDISLDKSFIDNSQEAYEANFGARDRENKESHLLLPIGLAHLAENEDKVIADQVGREILNTVPRHSEDHLFSEEHEEQVRKLYENEGGAQLTGEEKFNNKRDITDQIATPGEESRHTSEKQQIKTSGSEADNGRMEKPAAGSQSRFTKSASPQGPNTSEATGEISIAGNTQDRFSHKNFDAERFYGKRRG